MTPYPPFCTAGAIGGRLSETDLADRIAQAWAAVGVPRACLGLHIEADTVGVTPRLRSALVNGLVPAAALAAVMPIAEPWRGRQRAIGGAEAYPAVRAVETRA